MKNSENQKDFDLIIGITKIIKANPGRNGERILEIIKERFPDASGGKIQSAINKMIEE